MNTTPQMTSAKSLGVSSIIAALGLISLLSVMPAQAATYDWTGTTSTALTNPLNWSTGVAPTSIDIARWNAASYSNRPSAPVATTMTIGQFLFDSGNTAGVSFLTGSGTNILNGISSGGTNIGIQMNSGSGAVSLGSARIRLGASQTWLNDSSSSLSFAQAIQSASTGTPFTLTRDGTGNSSISGGSAIIADGTGGGTTAVTKTGTGTLTLAAANTFTGGLTINSGTVLAQTASNALGAGAVTLGDTTGSSSATLLYSGSTTLNFTNAIAVRAGSSGTLSIIANSGSSNNTTFSGAITLNNNLTVAQTGSGVRTNTFSGIISGGSGITIGSGNLGTVVVTGDNTYSGDTQIRAGTLAIGSASGNVTLALQNSTVDLTTGDTGTLRFGTSTGTTITSATFGGLKGSRNLSLLNANTTPAAVALTVGGNNSSTTYSGILSGAAGSLTKSGTGTLTLEGANAYTGGTTISAGSLIVNGSTASSSVLTVAPNATLGGSGTIGGATTINGILAPGNSIGTLTVANDVTWNSGNSWVFELGAAGSSILSPGTSDLLAITGGKDFLKGTGGPFTFDFAGTGDFGWYKLVDWAGGATTFAALDFAGVNLGGVYTSEFAIQNNALYVNVVPEPSTYVLVVGGILTLLLIRRRQRS